MLKFTPTHYFFPSFFFSWPRLSIFYAWFLIPTHYFFLLSIYTLYNSFSYLYPPPWSILTLIYIPAQPLFVFPPSSNCHIFKDTGCIKGHTIPNVMESKILKCTFSAELKILYITCIQYVWYGVRAPPPHPQYYILWLKYPPKPILEIQK